MFLHVSVCPQGRGWVSRPRSRGRLGGLAGGCLGPGPGGYAQGRCPGPGLGGCIPACTEADPPGLGLDNPPAATAADGTHPTGMDSC